MLSEPAVVVTTSPNVLRRLREARGLSVVDLARLVRCTHTYIWQLESGYYQRPSPRMLRRLSRALKVRLVASSDSAPPPPDTPRP